MSMETVTFIGCRIECKEGVTRGMFVKNNKPHDLCPEAERCPYGIHLWDKEYWKTHKVIYKT